MQTLLRRSPSEGRGSEQGRETAAQRISGGKLVSAVGAIVISVVLLALAVVGVKGSNGAFSGAYEVVGYFSGTGQGIYPGSAVEYKGIQVGKVSTVSLAGYRARLVMAIDHRFQLPTDATATIRPENIFGTEDVTLTYPAEHANSYLRPGGRLEKTATLPQLGDLLATADPFLQNLDARALSTVVDQLAQATRGEGPTIAEGWRSGSRAATVLASTIGQQIAALRSFQAFSAAIAGTGPTLNEISSDANRALPVLNAAAADFQRVMQNVTALSFDVASVIHDYQPDIQRLLASGDNVDRVLLANVGNIESLVQGLYQFVYKIGNGASPETLANGTKFAYFKTFILYSDIEGFVCSLLNPAEAGQAAQGPSSPLAYLLPLEKALAGSTSGFNCPSPPSVGLPNPLAEGSSPSQALSQLAQQVYQDLGAPQGPTSRSSTSQGGSGTVENGGPSSSPPSGGSLGELLNSILGGEG